MAFVGILSTLAMLACFQVVLGAFSLRPRVLAARHKIPAGREKKR